MKTTFQISLVTIFLAVVSMSEIGWAQATTTTLGGPGMDGTPFTVPGSTGVAGAGTGSGSSGTVAGSLITNSYSELCATTQAMANLSGVPVCSISTTSDSTGSTSTGNTSTGNTNSTAATATSASQSTIGSPVNPTSSSLGTSH